MKNNKGEGEITIIIFIAIIIWLISIFTSDKKDTGYNTNYSEDNYSKEQENPYSQGTGHSAGYEWAEKNDVSSCGGNSQSFIEGCEEYLNKRDN